MEVARDDLHLNGNYRFLPLEFHWNNKILPLNGDAITTPTIVSSQKKIQKYLKKYLHAHNL